MIKKYYEVEISKHDNRAKNGKRNETSMCIIGVREPSIKEAEKFLADDIIRVYKCTHVDKIREISKKEAYSSFDMENEKSFPIFGILKSDFIRRFVMDNKYICDCCGKKIDVDKIIFHSDYAIGICNTCYNKMDDDGEYDLWYACQDCNFCTADMVHDMLKELNNKSEQ